MADAPAAVENYTPVFFQPADYALVSRLADLIVPRTETPGALDAHVPFHIDQEVAASPELQAAFGPALQSLKAANFLTLSEVQQTNMLQSMSESVDLEQAHFFQTVKGLTVDWYYRSEEGLVKELGFHGNTFRAEFPGCTHPEHWPAAESK